jgi:hypothetical protein
MTGGGGTSSKSELLLNTKRGRYLSFGHDGGGEVGCALPYFPVATGKSSRLPHSVHEPS